MRVEMIDHSDDANVWMVYIMQYYANVQINILQFRRWLPAISSPSIWRIHVTRQIEMINATYLIH